MTRTVISQFCTLLLAIALTAIVLPACCAAAGLDANLRYLFQKTAVTLDAVRDVALVPDNLSAILRDNDGAIVREGELRFDAKERTASLNWPGKGISPGRYTLVLRTIGGGKVFMEKSWDLPGPPKWLGTEAGKFDDDWVPKPWTPLVLASSNPLRIECWGRRYAFGSSGLLESAQSGDDELLHGPMVWEASVDGRPLTWTPESMAAEQGGRGVIEFESSQRAEQLQLTCKGRMEFDGFVKLSFQLKSAASPVTIDKLSVAIPLRSVNATLMHYYPRTPVWLESGKETLTSYNAGSVPPAGWRSVFLPHIWIGNEEKGLQWLCESDEGWRPAEEAKAIEVLPQGETTVVRLNIIGKPVRLEKPRNYTFAFQASPVKPMPRERYDWHYTHCGGVDASHGWIDKVKDRGVRMMGLHCWTEWMGYPQPAYEFNARNLRSLVEACHQRDIKILPYHAPLLSNKAPEYTTVFPECRIVYENAFRCGGYDKDTVYTVCPRSIWADLEIDGIAKLLRDFNLDGIYSDSLTCCGDCSNTLHGCGYKGEDGKVHATVPIFSVRRFMKRIRRVLEQEGKEKGKEMMLIAHTSANITLPTLAFCDAYLDMEHLTGRPRPFRLPLDVFRAEFMGHNFGIPAQTLSYEKHGTGFTEQELLALSLLHDAEEPWAHDVMAPVWKAWDEFGVQKAEFLPYWKAWGWQAPEGVQVSAYFKPDGQMLVVAANLNEKEIRGTLRLKAPVITAVEAFSGNAATVADGAITDTFPVWKVKMYRLQLENVESFNAK